MGCGASRSAGGPDRQVALTAVPRLESVAGKSVSQTEQVIAAAAAQPLAPEPSIGSAVPADTGSGAFATAATSFPLGVGAPAIEEHFTDEQLRLWNVTKLLQRLAAVAADDPAGPSLPASPAAGSGARAASHLARRAVRADAGSAAAGGGSEGGGVGGGGLGEQEVAANARRQVSECAVSLEFLLEFAREIPDEWRTGQVVQELIKGFTVGRQSRFTDLMPTRHVKRPDYFISHKWDSPFHYLVRSVRDYLSGAVPGEVYVWLDIFAVNQHPGQEQQDDMAQLKNAITIASGGTLVVLDHEAGPLGRVWCLFEIWLTVREKGLGSLHLLTYGFTNNDIWDCFQAIDVKTAEATNEDDRKRILKYIERSFKSLDDFNEMLKLLFLLDPLDFTSDIKEMLHGITYASTNTTSSNTSSQTGTTAQAGNTQQQPYSGAEESPSADAGGASRPALTATRAAAEAAIAAQVMAARDAWQLDVVVGEVRRMDPASAQLPQRDSSRTAGGRAVSGPSLMIVYGVVGSGKSTFSASLARIAQERRERENRRMAGIPKSEEPVALLDLPEVQVDAVHFCRQSDRRRTDPLRMLKSLAYQLATNVPEMRPIYTSMPSESVSKISRLEEAFMELLQRPIQDYLEGSQLPSGAAAAGSAEANKGKDGRSRSKQLVLLIDGVDEADGRAGSLDNNILRLLREHFPKLHPAVHIIVSCRHTSKTDDPLAGLRGRYDKPRTIAYDAGTDLRQGEHMRRLLKMKLHPPGCRLDPSQCSMHDPEMLDMAVRLVIDKSRDSMVYIKVVLEHMSAVVKEHILRQLEERKVLESIKAVSDATTAAKAGLPQQPQQLLQQRLAQRGNSYGSDASSSRQRTPVDADVAAAELGATITALLSARLGDLAAGGSQALADLDQEVQDLIRGRFQSPLLPVIQEAERAAAPKTIAEGERGGAGRRSSVARGLAGRTRRGPSILSTAAGGGGWKRGGASEYLGALGSSEEDDFRWNWQDIKNLPNGLDAAYRQIFMMSFQKLAPQSHAQVMKLLQVLLAAREPLTRNQLQNLHLVSSPRDLQKLPGWGVLFYEREYMVFHMHKSLFDFLSNKKEAGPFFVDAQRGHKLIAAQLFKEIMVAPSAAAVASSAASVINGGAAGSDPMAASAVSQYTLRYAVTHLALADMLEELSQLLLNFDFWETIFEKGLGLEVLGDLIHIRGWELPKDSIASADVVAASSTVVSHVIRWLQRDGAMLKQYPKAVLQLATDTPVNSLVSKAALSYHRRPHAHLVNKDAGWPSNLMTLENSVHRTNSVAFLPKEDGGSSLRLVTGADDGVVRVWDMRSGDLLFAMQPPIQAYQGTPPAVKCIAVTSVANGVTVVASAGKDSAVRLWNIKTGQQFADLGKSNSAITGTVRALAVSPDGRTILSAGDDLALRVWTPGGKVEELVSSETGGPTGAPSAPVDDFETDPNKIWASPAVTSLQDKPHKKVIRCIAFSADGQLFATGSDDDASTNAVALCLWETEGLKPRAILRGHISSVKCVAFTTRPVSVTDAHSAAASSPVAAPQHLLASGSADRTVRLWYTRPPAGSSSPDGSSAPGSEEHWAVPNQKLQGHTACVRAVAFSPDGIKMASAGEDCSVRLWGVVSRQQLAVFHGHSGAVVSLSFDFPDGMVLASCSDTEVRLWDTNNYPQVTVMHGHESGVNTIAFTSDGKYLASGSDDGALVVWRDNGENNWSKVKTIPRDDSGSNGHHGSIIALAFSPADDEKQPGQITTRLLATASADKTIRLWALRETWGVDVPRSISAVAGILRGKGKSLTRGAADAMKKDKDGGVMVEQLSVVQGHDGSVRAISFSADGTLLATGSNDRTVRLWHLIPTPSGFGASISPFLVLSGHTDVIRCVAFSPVASSRLMASASEDRTVRLWHVAPAGQGASRLHRELRGHDSWVICCAFSSHGQRVATASLDKTVRIWSVTNGEQQLVLHGHSSGVTSVAFSPDSMTLVSGGADNSVRQWNARTGQQLAMMQGHIGQIAAVAYSPTGHAVGSGAADATVRLWDATRGQQVAGVQGDAGSFQTVAISPDDKFVSSSADDNVIRLWDMGSGEQRAVLQGHTSWIVAICFGYQDDNDGDPHLMLASCSDDCSIRVWDCVTSECVRELRGHTGSVRAVAWESLKWNYIASAGNDYTVRLWNVPRGSQVDLYKGHTDVIRSLAFSPDGLLLASSAEDTTIRLYHVGHITGSDAERPEWLPELPGSGVVLRGHTSWVLAVAFGQRKAATEDRLLVSGSWDQTVRLWNLPAAGNDTPTCVATLSGHTGRINGIAISTFVVSGLEIIASASNDSTMFLWTRTNRPELPAEASGWEAVCKIRGHAGHVNAVAFNSKGSRLASASEDETVRLWDLLPTSSPDQISAMQVRDFKGIQGTITVLSMSPDGQLLASGSDDHTLRLWSTRSNQQLMVLQGHGSAVSALAFDDEGALLASGSVCGSVLLWAKEPAGAGSREGWSQVAKLDLALQVPDAAVSALALTHYVFTSTNPRSTSAAPLSRGAAGSSDLDLQTAAAAMATAGLAPSAAASMGARLLLACGTKPREMQSRREGLAGGRHGGM
ncbi:hypothetical protein Agub_g6392, partial [Astrephomene gubernaculifera]